MNTATTTAPFTLRRFTPNKPVLILTMPSRMEYDTSLWRPEPDSPKAIRLRERNRVGRKERRKQSAKLHWEGSRCIHVKGKWAFLHDERTRAGDVFDAVPVELRCGTCHIQFMEG